MIALDIVLVFLAVVSLLRVEHLVASDLWIAFCGERWKRRVGRISAAGKSDSARMRRVYQETGGGKLPFLFFGIKSYRLLNWSDQAERRGLARRSRALRRLRFCWRYYTFVPALSCVVILLSVVPARLPGTASVSLLIIAFALVLGMLAIAAEGILAALVLGSWAVLYHGWGNLRKGNSNLREFCVIVGCVILTMFADFALVLCAQTRFDAYQDQSATIGWPDFRNAISTTFSGIVSDVFSASVGPLAFFIGLFTGVCYLAYFVFFAPVGAKLWSGQ